MLLIFCSCIIKAAPAADENVTLPPFESGEKDAEMYREVRPSSSSSSFFQKKNIYANT